MVSGIVGEFTDVFSNKPALRHPTTTTRAEYHHKGPRAAIFSRVAIDSAPHGAADTASFRQRFSEIVLAKRRAQKNGRRPSSLAIQPYAERYEENQGSVEADEQA